MDISSSSPELQRCTSSCQSHTPIVLLRRSILDFKMNFGLFPHPKPKPPTVFLFSVNGGYLLLEGQAKTLPHLKPNQVEILWALPLVYTSGNLLCFTIPLISLHPRHHYLCLM